MNEISIFDYSYLRPMLSQCDRKIFFTMANYMHGQVEPTRKLRQTIVELKSVAYGNKNKSIVGYNYDNER